MIRETPEDAAPSEEPGVVRLDAVDTLDLHTFQPRDTRSVVTEFLGEAAAAGHRQVRIIHGKGTGTQRRIVRSILDADPRVISYADAPDASSWGATIARLRLPHPRPAPNALTDPVAGDP